MPETTWTNEAIADEPWVGAFPEIDSVAALKRIAGSIQRTGIQVLPGHGRVTIIGKMENRQETGSFKSRGALNNMLLLTKEERGRGVVASSSGNHGRALAWAARRADVHATIVMPKDAYPNKIAACRSEGAKVVLADDRLQADVLAEELASEGRVWVHPYDRIGTIEGAGTVGVEIAQRPTGFDVVVACVGGGGLSAGSALALRRVHGKNVVVLGVEPVGAAAMTAGLREGASVRLSEITSDVQGLTTPFAGRHNVDVCLRTLDGTVTVTDEAIYAAQRVLVRDDSTTGWRGEIVEPAGAAAYAAALDPDFADFARQVAAARGLRLPLDGGAAGRLRVCVTVSGGNPAPAQLTELRS